MHTESVFKQNELDNLIKTQKQIINLENAKKKDFQSWILSQEEMNEFDELPGVNVFLSQCYLKKDSPYTMLLENKSKIISLVKLMLTKDFDFLNMRDFQNFCLISVKKNRFRSFLYENLLFNILFYILEKNLGNQQFETKEFLVVFVEIKTEIGKKRNLFALNNKILLAFSRLFTKNGYFFLETSEVLETLVNFLLDVYLETLHCFSKLTDSSKIGFTKFCLKEENHFAEICTRIFKFGIVKNFKKKSIFYEKLLLILDLFLSLEFKFRETECLFTDFFLDCFSVYNSILSFEYLDQQFCIKHSVKVLLLIFERLLLRGISKIEMDFVVKLFNKNLAFICSRIDFQTVKNENFREVFKKIESNLLKMGNNFVQIPSLNLAFHLFD